MLPFDPKIKALIQNWNQTQETQIKINLVTTNHAEDGQFINFTKQLQDIAPKLTIELEKKQSGLPGFLLKKNIRYSALPLEKELNPFLEALSKINKKNRMLSDQVKQDLDTLDIPVRLTLYIALGCPHCPIVVRTVIPLALYCTHITLHIIDGSLFPEAAQKEAVMSAPCLILDNDVRWTGSVTTQEITEMIFTRDPAKLSVTALKNILEQGDADWITRQMVERKKIFDAFIKLLIHETWSVRLGAMVIVEELAETDPELAVLLCPLLIDLFDKKDIPVQGDILYALGETGDQKTKDWITARLPKLKHQDLIDAAKEALDTIESKTTQLP